MNVIAEYLTPEGPVVVYRNPTVSYGVQWIVDVPGMRSCQHGTKRGAMQHARSVVRMFIPPPPRPNLLAAWDKLRTYG